MLVSGHKLDHVHIYGREGQYSDETESATSRYVEISNVTGAWAGLNGIHVGTFLDYDTYLIDFDSSGIEEDYDHSVHGGRQSVLNARTITFSFTGTEEKQAWEEVRCSDSSTYVDRTFTDTHHQDWLEAPDDYITYTTKPNGDTDIGATYTYTAYSREIVWNNHHVWIYDSNREPLTRPYRLKYEYIISYITEVKVEYGISDLGEWTGITKTVTISYEPNSYISNTVYDWDETEVYNYTIDQGSKTYETVYERTERYNTGGDWIGWYWKKVSEDANTEILPWFDSFDLYVHNGYLGLYGQEYVDGTYEWLFIPLETTTVTQEGNPYGDYKNSGIFESVVYP
jgi:outer membrane lipoprotein-sorting protein